MTENNNCDGSGPHSAGEVRVLPCGSDEHSGNMHLCRACFAREINFRRERNKEVSAPYDLPAFTDLAIAGAE